MSPQQTSLLIFTTSQSPLPVRYPHPHKPTLLLPGLIHRTLHNALDASPPSTWTWTSDCETQRRITIPDPEVLVKHDLPSRRHHDEQADHSTSTSTSTPTALDTDPAATNRISEPIRNGQSDDHKANGSTTTDCSEPELTVKIHLVGPGCENLRAKWVKEAIDILANYKGLEDIDTLLIGWNGVDYKGKRTIASEFFGCGAEGLTNDVGPTVVTPELTQHVGITWDKIVDGVGERVGRIGTLYLPLELLESLSEEHQGKEGKGRRTRPKVNSMDTPDCHSLPKEYTSFAREHGIELWAGGGGEGSDPLPAAELHNLLNEFYPSLPLSKYPNSKDASPQSQTSPPPSSPFSNLETPIPLRGDRLKYEADAKRGVQVNWVLGYTLVSKTRNVVKDKGYIVSAEFLP